jgi:hypothetical protein
MSPARTGTDTAPVYALIRSEVLTKMPQAFIVIFLLFFAVLAFAWFYLQRAKARDEVAEATDTATATPAEPAAPAAPAAERTDTAQ